MFSESLFASLGYVENWSEGYSDAEAAQIKEQLRLKLAEMIPRKWPSFDQTRPEKFKGQADRSGRFPMQYIRSFARERLKEIHSNLDICTEAILRDPDCHASGDYWVSSVTAEKLCILEGGQKKDFTVVASDPFGGVLHVPVALKISWLCRPLNVAGVSTESAARKNSGAKRPTESKSDQSTEVGI